MKLQDLEKTMKSAERRGFLLMPEDLEYYQNMKERRFYIEHEVTKELMDALQSVIQDLNDEDYGIPIKDRTPIRIYIDTNGGDLYATLSSIDYIQMSETPVWTICKGTAYSAGGLLLLAGHKKFCYKNSSFLLHSGSNGYIGKTDSMFDSVEFDKKVIETTVKNHVIDNSNISNELYEQNYRKEWFMDSNEMLELGIVDEISDKII